MIPKRSIIPLDRLGYMAVIAVLLGFNLWILIGKVTERRIQSDTPYDLPRSRAILGPHEYVTMLGTKVIIPSNIHSATVVYISDLNDIAIGELSYIESMAHSSLSQNVCFVWINSGPMSRKPTSIDFKGKVLTINGTPNVLHQLGLINPRPNTIIITRSNEITYEGTFSEKYTIRQILDASGLTIESNADIMPGAPSIGAILSERARIDLSTVQRPTVLLLYAGYCNVCGAAEIYKMLRSFHSIDVYSVFPYISQSSGLHNTLKVLNANMDFHFLETNTSSIKMDHFILKIPVILLINKGRVVLSNINDSNDWNIIDNIVSLYGREYSARSF
jgi:hypothetical protein